MQPRFSKRLPPSALAPLWKLSLPLNAVNGFLGHLVDADEVALVSGSHSTVSGQIISRRNKDRVEHTLSGWRQLAEGLRVQAGDMLTFTLVQDKQLQVDLASRLTSTGEQRARCRKRRPTDGAGEESKCADAPQGKRHGLSQRSYSEPDTPAAASSLCSRQSQEASDPFIDLMLAGILAEPADQLELEQDAMGAPAVGPMRPAFPGSSPGGGPCCIGDMVSEAAAAQPCAPSWQPQPRDRPVQGVVAAGAVCQGALDAAGAALELDTSTLQRARVAEQQQLQLSMAMPGMRHDLARCLAALQSLEGAVLSITRACTAPGANSLDILGCLRQLQAIRSCIHGLLYQQR